MNPWVESQIDGVNNWTTSVSAPGGIEIISSPGKLQVGMAARVKVYSSDARYLNATCTLTVVNDSIVEPISYTAPMQVDPAGGVSALFHLAAIAAGNTNISASVPDL